MKTFLSLSKEVTKREGKPFKGHGKAHLRFNVRFALRFNILMKPIWKEFANSQPND